MNVNPVAREWRATQLSKIAWNKNTSSWIRLVGYSKTLPKSLGSELIQPFVPYVASQN